MRIVILGCGRVGSDLARRLVHDGHEVSVIDQAAEPVERLGPDFPGNFVQGIGFDRDVLIRAGIEDADGFAAVSSGDNSNIIAARVARETFDVQNVVARIYDPRRADVYQRLGIPTVATIRWTSDQVMRRLQPAGALDEWRDPSGNVVLAEVHIGSRWIGHSVTKLESEAPLRVSLITRRGTGMVPLAVTALQEGDLVHATFAESDRSRVELVCSRGPEDSD